MNYLGDYKEDATVLVMFNTFTSNDPSASSTITNFANTDVHIHKDDDLTQRNNAAGITVSVNFDGITGSHMIKIDTNDNTVAGFWVTGKDYFVRIEGTTVDGATINAVVGHFSIENRHNEVDVVKWLGQACHAVSENGVPKVDLDQIGGVVQSLTDLKDLVDTGYDPTNHKIQSDLIYIHGSALTETAGQLAAAFVKLFDVATPVLTAESVNQSANNNTILAHGTYGSSALQVLIAALQTDLDNGTDGLGALKALIDTNKTELDGLQGADGKCVISTDAQDLSGTLDVNTKTITAGIIAMATLAADIGSTAYGTNKIALACRKVLDEIKLDHLVAIADNDDPVNNSIIAKLVSSAATADWSAFVHTTDSLQALRDRGDAAWTTGTGGSDRLLMVDTTIATLASQTSFTLTAGSADDNAYRNCTIVIEDASTATQKAIGVISAYTGATKTITLKYDPAVFTMATTDKVYILAENALKSTLANRQLNVAADGDIAGNIDGSVASVVGHTVQTGDGYAILNNGTHGNAALETLVDEIETILKHATYGNSALQVLVAALQTDLDNGTDGLGALKALIDTNKSELDGLQGTDGKVLISTDAQDLSGSFDVNTKTATATALDLILKNSTFALAIADATWDELITEATHGTATSAGKRMLEVGAYAIHSGTAQAGTSVQITLAATATAIDGTYNRNLLVLTDGTGKGQTRTIIDYNGTTKVAVTDREWRTNPDATSKYQIVADDTPLVSDQGIAQAGSTSSTIKLRAYASATNDIYLCNVVIIVAGTGRGQARLVGSYNGTTKVVTICGDNWITTPDTTSVYVMIPYGATCACCICDYALGQINAEVDNVLDTAIPGSPTAGSINEKIKALPSGIAKNTALANFEFLMVLSSDHISPATGKTVACQRSIDGGAFANCNSATATEVSNGVYKNSLATSDLNGDVITLKFSEANCDTTLITIKTDS